MRDLLHAALVVTCLALVAVAPVHAQADPVALWLTQVTTQRLNAGLPPLELSPQLAAAAQRHANDLAANGLKSPTGSDASSPQQRITEAGYVAWTLDDGDPVIGEIYYVGSEPADQAFAVFLQDTPSVDVLLDPRFREIGIGIAADSAGVSYHVLTLGARPNVLPIFINDGAPSAVDPVVAIHLTNETVR
ncbi:MAG: CAP domain-containing protein, partial [Anaerolineales bacterium]|nr:CAP domain-containing protein [Anaerolineales bacterium]